MKNLRKNHGLKSETKVVLFLKVRENLKALGVGKFLTLTIHKSTTHERTT
jgi:hypothetical protein